MSQYGSSGPADPWNDETVRQDVPSSTPPVSTPPASSGPSVPPAAAGYQPGFAQPQYGQPQYQPPQYEPQYQPAAYPQYDQPYPAANKKSPAVLILSILLVAVVLAAAGIVIYLWQSDGSTEPPPAVPTVGECLVSDNSANNPLLTEATCGPDTYKVLKIARGTVDTGVCNGVDGVTNNYVFQWPINPSINDYVLCLQKQ